MASQQAGMETQKPSEVVDMPWIYEMRHENVVRHNYSADESGKWMMFFPSFHIIDAAWERAKALYRSDQLPEIKCMKVSTAQPSDFGDKVLILYCGPASDKQQMLLTGRDVASKMEYHQPFIYYKSDVQTRKGTRMTGQTKNYLYRIRL